MKLILAFLSTFLLSAIIFISFVVYMTMIRNPPLFEYSREWFINVYKAKGYINSLPTQKQRLIIISGSNSLFGFDGSIIDDKTSFQPINYATAASVKLNYHIDKIISHTKSGDIIFMPLEFHYYTDIEPIDDVQYIHDMLTWGNGYDKYITKSQRFNAYIKNSPFGLLRAFIGSIIKPEPSFDIEHIFTNTKHNGTYYTSLNKYGDFCYQEGKEIDKINSAYLDANLTLSSFFISEYKRLESWAKQNNIKIFLTYPVTAENPSFSLADTETFAKIDNLKNELKKAGIEIYGDFRDFHFEQQYFYDTHYHLNREGAILRTQNFIKMLESMQKDGIL